MLLLIGMLSTIPPNQITAISIRHKSGTTHICSPFLRPTTFLQSKIGLDNGNGAEQSDGTTPPESPNIARHASEIELRNRLDLAVLQLVNVKIPDDDGLSKNVERLAMELACWKPPSTSSSQNGMDVDVDVDVDVNDVRNRLDRAILTLVNGSNTDPEREGLIQDVERMAMELNSLSKLDLDSNGGNDGNQSSKEATSVAIQSTDARVPFNGVLDNQTVTPKEKDMTTIQPGDVDVDGAELKKQMAETREMLAQQLLYFVTEIKEQNRIVETKTESKVAPVAVPYNELKAATIECLHKTIRNYCKVAMRLLSACQYPSKVPNSWMIMVAVISGSGKRICRKINNRRE